MEYLVEDPATLEDWTQRFVNSHRRWAIVGPHGSGKSTLLHTLVPRLQEALGQLLHQPIEVCWRRLSSDQRAWKSLQDFNAPWTSHHLIVLDGYEQLHSGLRLWLWKKLKATGAAGLVTCHRKSFLFPILLSTLVKESDGEKVIRKLLSDRPGLADRVLSSSRWKSSRQRWGTNFRESLFDMYDYLEEIDG